jgi:hypothetical protein
MKIFQKKTYPPVFVAVLFITAPNWKQPKCSPTENSFKNYGISMQ